MQKYIFYLRQYAFNTQKRGSAEIITVAYSLPEFLPFPTISFVQWNKIDTFFKKNMEYCLHFKEKHYICRRNNNKSEI